MRYRFSFSNITDNKNIGFTLIELSIVLVIIGLIVGGVLVGQDLINAAAVRAQISQIEKYKTATFAFKSKYGGLPGDLNATSASAFGFTYREGTIGKGDDDGILRGAWGAPSSNGGYGCPVGAGETALFWSDLSKAKMIDGSYTAATADNTPVPSADITGLTIAQYMPSARIGNGNYVYVWSGGIHSCSSSMGYNQDNFNYFGISVVTSIDLKTAIGQPESNVGMTVTQAYAIDTKIDDGLPQYGKVTASYNAGGSIWATGPSNPTGEGAANYTTDPFGLPVQASDNIQTPPDPASCYDNGSASAVEHYSMSVNGGAGLNCALSIQF